MKKILLKGYLFHFSKGIYIYVVDRASCFWYKVCCFLNTNILIERLVLNIANCYGK